MQAQSFAENFRQWARHSKRLLRFQTNRFRSNAAIFDDIYTSSRWGGAPGQIYSGSGSEGEPAELYAATIVQLLAERRAPAVVDIGCGDFRIGAKIAPYAALYTGLDVSPHVIAHNAKTFASERVRFAQCDATRDPLPAGDLCLIRQVLQHLSNRDIERMMRRVTAAYDLVVVTEHYPAARTFRSFNADKPTGADIRAAIGSGVYLDKPPFDFTVTNVLLDLPLSPAKSYAAQPGDDPDTWEHMKTFVVRPYPDAPRRAQSGVHSRYR